MRLGPRVAIAWRAAVRRARWLLPRPHVRPPRGLKRVGDVEALGPGIDVEQQLREDLDTLRNIVSGLDRLEGRLDRTGIIGRAVQRGYFAPGEEEIIRHMMLVYRNYRFGAYEIIFRYRRYAAIEAPYLQLRCFLLAYAAALTLIAKSLKIIEVAEHVPLLRAVLNAPDKASELPPGLFDDVLAGFSSLGNYRILARAGWFWRRHRRALPRYGLTTAQGWRDWVQFVRRERLVVRHRLARVLWARLRYDWRLFWRTLLLPATGARQGLESFVGARIAAVNQGASAASTAIGRVLDALADELQTGDILLSRTEGSVGAAILPGFWVHAAIYLRSRDDLERLGVHRKRAAKRTWHDVPAGDHAHGLALEAITPCVRIVPLERCLAVDHVVVLRPRMAPNDLGAAIGAAIAYLGTPYDFEVDFATDSRVVCTELVYRSYHGRGPVAFPLVRRLGRFTLTGDDMISLALDAPPRAVGIAERAFDLPVLVLTDRGEPVMVRGPDVQASCARIRDGWRPEKRRGAPGPAA